MAPGKIAHDGMGFPENKTVVVDDRHQSVGIHRAVLGRIVHAKRHAGINAIVGQTEFAAGPQHLLHINRILASPYFQHVWLRVVIVVVVVVVVVSVKIAKVDGMVPFVRPRFECSVQRCQALKTVPSSVERYPKPPEGRRSKRSSACASLHPADDHDRRPYCQPYSRHDWSQA